MEIETKNASLDTMAVTIMALHVSGKQMTQAVFKQLPYKDESDKSELWGIVRYSIKDQADIWLVFSEGGTLFRRGVHARDRHAGNELLRELQNDVKKCIQSLECKSNVVTEGMSDGNKDYYNKQKSEAKEALAKAQLKLDEEIIEYNSDVLSVKQFNDYEKKIRGMQQLFIAV